MHTTIKTNHIKRLLSTNVRIMAVLLLMLVVSLLSGCGGLDILNVGGKTELLGKERAEDPMAATEAYLRQYQPGQLPRLFQTTRIYDRNGTLLAETFGEGRRTWIGIDKVSQHLIDATIAVEDSTFYSNTGVDAVRIAGAAIQNLQEGEIVSGASTITMQLARNLFMGSDQRYDQSVDRKVLEAGLAQELNDLYSKDELLEMYLNLLNYGQLAYGPEAASNVYFGKPASDLTLAEATMLAGIPQQPANMNPYIDMDAAKRRQRVVLDMMVRHEYLTQAESDDVYDEEIELAGDKGLAPNLAPHFVQYVINEMDEQLGEGYTQRAGFQITTSLDLHIQELAQTAVHDSVAVLQPQYDLSNGALVALQTGTGDILAMVGSADFTNDEIAGQVNVAISPRQPGSAIKPVLYAAAIEENLISPASVLWDVPVTYTVGLPQNAAGLQTISGDGLVYQPHNYDGEYHGPVTARASLANSYNVPTVKLLEDLGVDTMLNYARDMGISSLQKDSDWYGLSLTLGGGEVTLLDLTTAYHTLANGGGYLKPRAVLAISDSQGRLIEEFPVEEPIQVLSPDTTYIVTDILADNQARTPAFGPSSSLRLSVPAAAKTGTTTDYRDNWTVGYINKMVAGVWAGNSDGHPMQNASGVTGAAPIWHTFMESVLADASAIETLNGEGTAAGWVFPKAKDVAHSAECPTGLNCSDNGEYFRTSWVESAVDSNPFFDAVVKTDGAPVLVQKGDQVVQVGYCELEGASERLMMRMPQSVRGRDDEEAVALNTLMKAAIEVLNDGEQKETQPESWTAEQVQALLWAVQHGSTVDFGPCEYLGAHVSATAPVAEGLLDGMRMAVDVTNAERPADAPLTMEGTVELASIAASTGDDGWTGPRTYRLAESIVNNNDCPGQYIMGQIVDSQGAPISGVRLLMRDPWGNEAETHSKDGQADYGQFDFPIWADGSLDYVLTVMDDGGNQISAPIIIPHRKDDASNTSCHMIRLQGG